MPGIGGGILTPGRGPNGPGPIDMRAPISSVGNNSTIPYGPTNGYATPNGVTGFIGPAAGSLRQATAWFVRTGGVNTNGGSTSSTSASRTGSDGATTSGSLTFTSASAAFTVSDIGSGVCIQNATRCYAKIVSINSATSVQLSNPPSATASSLSWAIGGAWADPQPVLNSNTFANTACGVQSGDIVYVGAGTYRVVESVGANFGSSWNAVGGTVKFANAGFNGQASIVGDVTGQFTGDAGMVQLTAYTTNDKTAPSGTSLVNLNGKSNLAFSNIMIVGGNATVITSTTLTSQNISWADCSFMSGFNAATASMLSLTCQFQTYLNWNFNRCDFLLGTATQDLIFNLTTGNGTVDYSANVLLQNCRVIKRAGSNFIQGTNTGALTNNGGGVVARSCFFFGPSFMGTTASRNSTVFPFAVYDSFLYTGGTTSLNAGTSGQIIEAYNLFVSSAPRTLVNAGTGSISDGSYAPLVHFGQERIWNPPLFRAFGEPMASSPLLGFGGDGAQTPYDSRGLNWQRPAGGGSALPAVGAMERADTFVSDPSPIGGGGSPIKITGPGYNQFLLPIQASEVNQARTVSVKVKWDSSYVTGTLGNGEVATLPSLNLIAKPQQGVLSNLSVVAAGSAGSVFTITLPAFTPTAVGVLTLQVSSFDLSGVSVVEFDDFTIV